MKRLPWTLILATMLCAGCSDQGDPEGPATPDGLAEPVSYAADIQPIFSGSCVRVGCHDAAGTSAGLSLTAGGSYEQLVGVSSVRYAPLLRVAPGDADSSALYRLIAGVLAPGMPPGEQLDAQEVETVRSWIADGAEEN